MAKRKTIGENPLDAVVPKPTANPQETKRTPKDGSSPGSKASQQPAGTRKDRLTIQLPAALIERAKNAVYWTPGLTLAKLSEKALEQTLESLEKQHKGPFPIRTEELKGGRPIK